MNIFYCKLLIILVEEENITKSAERLYTSQSNLSYHIKSLERKLGCVLFERYKNGVIPTQECRLVIEFAKKMLAEYEELEKQIAVSKNPEEYSEKLKVGVTTSIATHFLRHLLKTFQSAHPYIQISWFANNSDIVMKRLEDASLDVAIVRGDIEWNGKKALLFEEPIYLVSRKPVNLEQLPVDETYLMQPNSNENSKLFQWWNEHYGENPRKSIEIDNIESCLQLIDQDFGFTFLPALSLRGKKKYITTQLKWTNGKPLIRKTWCFCRKDHESVASDTFFEFIEKTMPKIMAGAIYGTNT
jgi:DNA-binding transcriptional LysR family regulator